MKGMRKEYFLPADAGRHGDFAVLCHRRRLIEADIAHQEVRVAEVLSRLVSPRHVAGVLSGIAMDGVKSGFSLFGWVMRGWQWLGFVRRFVTRFL